MNIKLSPKHGVNPSLMVCPVCGEEYGVALLGRLPGDAEAPRRAVYENKPCDKCKEYMKQGVILISVRDGEEGSDNPYRTGGWVVVKREAIRRIVTSPELAEEICAKGVAYVPDSVWDMLGLPRGDNTKGENE